MEEQSDLRLRAARTPPNVAAADARRVLRPTSGHRKTGSGSRRLGRELQRRLRDLRPADQFESLADQLVCAGRMNWAKYRLVQASLVLALVAVFAVSAAGFLP
jgi:hypothetical protein